MALVDEMDDHLYVLAAHCVGELCAETERLTGQKLTIAELCSLLVSGINSCGDGLADANGENVVSLQPKLKKSGKVTIRAGDVVAIPAAQKDHFHWAVYITSNRFGHAFGVLRGTHPRRPLPTDPVWRPDVLPHPIYTTLHSVADGRWSVTGHAPHLLSLFAAQPEIYHPKRYHLNDPRIGAFGAAESPTGELRNLTEQEARDLGVLSGEYEVAVVPDRVETMLHRKHGGKVK
jgi:hypothetical protein